MLIYSKKHSIKNVV